MTQAAKYMKRENSATNLPRQPIHLANLTRGSTSVLSHQRTKSPLFLLKNM